MNITMEKTLNGAPYIKMTNGGKFGNKAYVLQLDHVLIRADGMIFKAPPETKGLDPISGAYAAMVSWWLKNTDGVADPAVSTADPPDGG